MSVKLKLLPKPKDNSDMFEEKTIDCPPNTEGLFRYAETITKSEIPVKKGREFVLEMLKFGREVWLTNQAIANGLEKKNGH